MKKTDFGIEIVHVANGFIIKDNEGNTSVIKSEEDNEISAAEELLWKIIDFFDLRRSRYNRERIRIVREVGDKYELQEDEKIIKERYRRVIRKKPRKNK